jgi:hypothetical protein
MAAMTRFARLLLALVATLALCCAAACNDSTPSPQKDAAADDAASHDDATVDAPRSDAGQNDGAANDAAPGDAAPGDAAPGDAAHEDAALQADSGHDSNSGDGRTPAELCTDTGGTIDTGLCCSGAGNFPSSCATGTCGCAPDYSTIVAICYCPATKCYQPGTGCIAH